MTFALVALLLGLALAFSLGGDSASEPEPEVEPINGTDGDDEIFAGDRDNLIRGLDGDDTLHGGGGNDTLEGGAGDDLLYTGPGNDLADGGSGNDTLESWFGNDTLLGGDGDDTLLIASEGTTLAEGGAGNDLFDWRNGDATLRGGDGDDEFRIRLGSDSGPGDGLIEGGAGEDTLNALGWTESSIIIDADDTGTLLHANGEIRFTGIETIRMGDAVTRFDASASDAGYTVSTSGPSNQLGSSTIIGSGGDDHLINGSVMDGGDGDDILERTSGGGTLTGGEGSDSFVIGHARFYDGQGQAMVSSTTTITDFAQGEDQLQLNVRYVASYTNPDGQTIVNEPPVVTLVEDPETNETRVMVNASVAVVLHGVSGLDLSDLDIDVSAY